MSLIFEIEVGLGDSCFEISCLNPRPRSREKLRNPCRGQPLKLCCGRWVKNGVTPPAKVIAPVAVPGASSTLS